MRDGTLVANWLVETDASIEAYNLMLSYSKDDGATWARPFMPHNDKTTTQHGFAVPPLVEAAGLAARYREVLAHLSGERDLPSTIDLVKTRTRQFAKRQRTWFRSLSECREVAAEADDDVLSVVLVHFEEVGAVDDAVDHFPHVVGVRVVLRKDMEEVFVPAARVVARLRVEVNDPTLGRCRACGKTCAPWFPLCDRCFSGG